jgi:hypothetical protein
MSTGKRPPKRSEARGYSSRKLAPFVEAVESRELLDGGVGVITGTAFVDNSNSGQLDLTNPYLAGATVQLFQAGSTSPLGTATTGADGRYEFYNLAPGDYVVTETPPSGYQATGTQVLSQFEPASAAGTNSIRVTVPASSVFVNYNGIAPNQYEVTNNLVDGTPVVNSDGPFLTSLGTSAGATDLSANFLSYCLDDLHSLSFGGGEQFPVAPQPISALSNNGATIPADRSGRIAFLYNHFGTSSLTNIQGAALQLAIWELLYDTGATADFSAGNFQVVGPDEPFTDQATLDQVLAQANAYFNLSAGHSETAILLNDSPNASADGNQSVIATGSFNFANKPGGVGPIQESSLSGFVYCDDNNDGQFDNGDMPISGVTVALTGTDATTGSAVDEVTQTDAIGAYHFLNLNPGVYTITETVPQGYTAATNTQGTPGTGTVGPVSFNSIALAGGIDGQNNDFGERAIPVSLTNLSLYGIHQQPSRIVLTFDGPLSPASAQNTSNYSLLALGKVQRLGSVTNHPVAIASAVYNPAANTVTLSPVQHLNIHSHYVLQLNLSPATPCGPAVTSTQVFGRAQVPVWTIHGRTIPAPPMTAAETLNDRRIDADTLARLGASPPSTGLTGAIRHATAVPAHAVSLARTPVHLTPPRHG